jgi:hypothetical protein
MENLAQQQLDNGAISGTEYSAKCEQLREREKKLTS